jgi:hypothetical protein
VKRLPAAERKGHEELASFYLARATEELDKAREHALLAGIPAKTFDAMINQQYARRNDPNRSLEIH